MGGLNFSSPSPSNRIGKFILYYIAAYCDACCKLGIPRYSYTDDKDFIPDSKITFYDANEATPHNASSIRPGSSGVELSKQRVDQANPYVMIDIDEPGNELSTVDISDIILQGNVVRVKIYVKERDTDASWVFKTMTVEYDGNVILPTSWLVGDKYMVPIGIIKIVPLDTNPAADYYNFTVGLYGCRQGSYLH